MYNISKILVYVSSIASVNTTIYLNITRDLTGLKYGNILFSICVLFCFFSLLLYICDASFNWTLSFIPLLTSLSLSSVNIIYPSSFIIPKFHAAFSYISVKYFNSLPVSIEKPLSFCPLPFLLPHVTHNLILTIYKLQFGISIQIHTNR